MAQENLTIFCSIPSARELRYYTGLIDPTEERDDSVPTNFQWQVLKTRFLIWKNPQILAAPVPFQFANIHVIASAEFESSGQLAEAAKRLRIKLKGPSFLSTDVYEECVMYSLAFRLAPQWNKINNFFINNSTDFLTCAEPMDAVKLESRLLQGDKLIMSLKAIKAKLPLLNLVDLGINLDMLKARGVAPIEKKIFILPQMKAGMAKSIITKIPPSCPFQKYSQIRRHWKNSHGYRLPHDEEGMLYVQVSFSNSTLYSYPVMCVRTSKVHQLKCKTPVVVVTNFAQDIMKKCSSICGHPVQFNIEEGNIFRPVPKLQSAREATELANLTVIELQDVENRENSLGPQPGSSTSTPQRVPSAVEPNLVTVEEVPETSATTSSEAAKRVLNVQNSPDEGPVGKKSQSEIEAFAKLKCLEKCNLRTLQAFCKDNGIVNKSRDRKEAVVQKVYDFFGVE